VVWLFAHKVITFLPGALDFGLLLAIDALKFLAGVVPMSTALIDVSARAGFPKKLISLASNVKRLNRRELKSWITQSDGRLLGTAIG
jgi:hypothetical protein